MVSAAAGIFSRYRCSTEGRTAGRAGIAYFGAAGAAGADRDAAGAHGHMHGPAPWCTLAIATGNDSLHHGDGLVFLAGPMDYLIPLSWAPRLGLFLLYLRV